MLPRSATRPSPPPPAPAEDDVERLAGLGDDRDRFTLEVLEAERSRLVVRTVGPDLGPAATVTLHVASAQG